MSTRKTTTEKIELQRERMEEIQNEMKRLLNQQKTEERKKRNHRICKRGAHLESLLPNTVGLSDTRFFSFLEKTVANDFGRRALAALVAEQEKEDATDGDVNAAGDGAPSVPSVVAAAQGGNPPAHKPAAPPMSGGAIGADKPVQPKTVPIGADAGRTGDRARVVG